VDQHASTANRFSAAGPALGYLAQVDYALLVALRRLDLQDDFSLSIETLDDIVFHHAETDSATEKWQSKHSIDENRSLTDGSVDVWKTFHNWIVGLAEGDTRHVLLTTSRATGACSKLISGQVRDVPASVMALERTARESQSATNRPYYEVFLGLDPDQRQAFVDSVEVIDEVASAGSVVDDLMRAVRRRGSLLTPEFE
jgi:hypothetical protein